MPMKAQSLNVPTKTDTASYSCFIRAGVKNAWVAWTFSPFEFAVTPLLSLTVDCPQKYNG
jgi:hypothetical protein